MRRHSIFWPLVLVAAGVIWLMIGVGGLPASNLWALYYLAPYALVALGIGMILRARWMWMGHIFSVLVVGGAVLAVVFAPLLGWDRPADWGCAGGEFPFQGCNWFMAASGGQPGSGVVVSEKREMAEFNRLSIEVPAIVTIQQGEPQALKLEGEDNFLPQLGTQVVDGELRIEWRTLGQMQGVYPTKPVRIDLTVKDLQAIDFSSAGSLDIAGFQTNALKVSSSGAGRLTLNHLSLQTLTLTLSGAGTVSASGSTGDLNLDISGVGNFKGAELSTQTARVNMSGVGNAVLRVAQHLTVGISGAGSLSYYGSPQVQKQVSGVGSVRKLGD